MDKKKAGAIILLMFIRPQSPQFFFLLGTPKKIGVCVSGGYYREIAAAYSK
jgi:hypothetical protein